MQDAGVYAWVNLTNSKVYVGSAKHISTRKSAHLRALNSGNHHSPHFQAAWDKYGTNSFKFHTLEKVNDEIWLRARETAWIKRLRSAERTHGYNITRDGWTVAQLEPTERRRDAWKKNGERRKGTKDSPEVRAKKKLASKLRSQTVKFAKDIAVRRVGKIHSKETREKLRAAWERKKIRGYIAPSTFTTAGRPSWNKGKLFSKESCARMSIAQKATWTPERRAAQAERLRKLKLNNPNISHLAAIKGAAARWEKTQ